MALTYVAIRNAKRKEKSYKLFDTGGLYLLVHHNGSKYWQLKYRFLDKEKTFSLGVYDEIGLQEARERRDDVRKQLRNGVDPSNARKEAKRRAKAEFENSFRKIAEMWHKTRDHIWTRRHAAKVLKMLKADIFPMLGGIPIEQITAPDLLAVLRKIEARGAHYTAHRTQQIVGQIFRFAVASGMATRDISADLRGALKPSRKTNYARLSDNELPEFIEKLNSYDGSPQTQIATKLLLLTFVRTNELRAAKWAEVDFEKREWRIPAERMKMRKPHIVPLSDQAIDLFSAQKSVTGDFDFVFPNRNHPMSCMSENTIIFAIYRLGYHSRTTAHGFRGTASTILNENGFNPDVIERQLAHGDHNLVRASYNHAQYLPERRQMMQWWADYLEKAKN